MVANRFKVTFKPGRLVVERVAMEHGSGTVQADDLMADE
jgi:hypothetical protein